MFGRGCSCLGAIIGVIIILVVIAIIGIIFIYSGFYNVAATYPDSAPAEWVLSTTMDRSVQHHAKGIKVPNLNDPSMIQKGAGHYKDDCVMCHGAPGASIGEVGRGLNPKPPELAKVVKDWKPNELFWIAKNGIRMTGMPAWKVEHSDEDTWHIVAFLEKLPSMTPAQYKAMSAKAPPDKE